MNSNQHKALAKLEEWREKVPYEVWSRIPLDMDEVGKHWGVKKVIKRPLDVAGLLYRLEEGGSVVFLKEGDPPNRQRFSWAHELGHIVMAGSDLPEMSCRQQGQINRDLERCCDVIAAELLMPAQKFCQTAEQADWDLGAVNDLARHFKVSTESAAIRMIEFQSEPVVMSMWRAGKGPLATLDQIWTRSNESAEKLKPTMQWKSGPDALGPIYDALQAAEVTSGSCRLLVRPREQSRSRSYKWVPTQGLGIGNGRTRRVIGFHYLARNS